MRDEPFLALFKVSKALDKIHSFLSLFMAYSTMKESDLKPYSKYQDKTWKWSKATFFRKIKKEGVDYLEVHNEKTRFTFNVRRDVFLRDWKLIKPKI